MKEIILNRVFKTRPNYKKYKTLIDDEDFERVNQYNWTITQDKKYAHRKDKKNNTILLHNFITGFKETDHKDVNGLNNQKYNLREATRGQNQINKRKRENTTSKYKGVTWLKINKKWMAQIHFNNKHVYLGLFQSEIEAAKMYNTAAKKHHGEFARLNEL